MINNKIIDKMISDGNNTGRRIDYNSDYSGINNLFIRHNANNRIVFMCRYNIGSVDKKKIIGYYPLVKIDDVIKIIDKVTLLALSGVDYFKEEDKNKNRMLTLKDFIETIYIEDVNSKGLSPATLKNKKHIHSNLESKLLNKCIVDIDKTDIKPILDNLIKLGKKSTAKQWFLELRTIFKVAVFEDIINSNPLDKIRQPVLEDNKEVKLLELHKLFNYEIAKIKDITDIKQKSIILLLAHLGIRISELVEMKWVNIDFENKILNNYQIKTNSINRIPLTDEVIGLLDILRVDNDTDYVCIAYGKKMIADTVNRMLKKHNLIFTPHDFRRSFSTIANNAGIFLPINIEMCLGHEVRYGAEANYTLRQDYLNNKRIVFDWYSKLLVGIYGVH